MTLGENIARYSALNHALGAEQNPDAVSASQARDSMVHPTRVKSKALNGIPHLPFQEFATSSLEALLELLKKAKIKDSEIEISASTESQHTACSKALVHVMVMTSKGEGDTAFKDLAALYQYCPECHLTVRIL